MNKVRIVQVIVRLYFVSALAGSFTHIIESAHKTGLVGWEAWSTPFMVDGLALIGLVMRSGQFATQTRKLGFRVQLGMGSVSLVANVYAANSLGGVLFGVGIVGTYVLAEWLSGQLRSAQDEAQQTAVELAKAKRQDAARRGAETRRKNAAAKARRRKQEAKVLESMLNV